MPPHRWFYRGLIQSVAAVLNRYLIPLHNVHKKSMCFYLLLPALTNAEDRTVIGKRVSFPSNGVSAPPEAVTSGGIS